MPEPVLTWLEIAPNYRRGLLLGNGSSRAFSPAFQYASLKAEALEKEHLADALDSVFEHLATDDFEWVLRMLWHAATINRLVGVDEAETTAAYNNVRGALIEAVRTIHPGYVAVENLLGRAADFIRHFRVVCSLNYDLLVYWALMRAHNDAPYSVKDCFSYGRFERDWREFLGDATLVAYPHGSLAFVTRLDGEERKISRGGSQLLGTIFRTWRLERGVPLFVSEGSSDQKIAAIERSVYLSTVFYELLATIGPEVAVLGWSMGEQDSHILEALSRANVQRMAIGVNADDATLEQEQVRYRQAVEALLPDCVIEFFDWRSPGCWINASPVGA